MTKTKTITRLVHADAQGHVSIVQDVIEGELASKKLAAALSPQQRPRKQKGTDAIPTQSKDSEEK